MLHPVNADIFLLNVRINDVYAYSSIPPTNIAWVHFAENQLCKSMRAWPHSWFFAYELGISSYWSWNSHLPIQDAVLNQDSRRLVWTPPKPPPVLSFWKLSNRPWCWSFGPLFVRRNSARAESAYSSSAEPFYAWCQHPLGWGVCGGFRHSRKFIIFLNLAL